MRGALDGLAGVLPALFLSLVIRHYGLLSSNGDTPALHICVEKQFLTTARADKRVPAPQENGAGSGLVCVLCALIFWHGSLTPLSLVAHVLFFSLVWLSQLSEGCALDTSYACLEHTGISCHTG